MVEMLDNLFSSVSEKLGDTRSELEIEQDQAITDALERGEETFIDPVTGLPTDIDTFEGRDIAFPTIDSPLYNLNSPTISPIQIGLGLLNPAFSMGNLLSKGLFNLGIQDIDPFAQRASENRDVYFSPNFDSASLGTTRGRGLLGMQQPYTTPINSEPLAPPIHLHDSSFDNTGGTLTGDEDWSGAYDADASGFL